MDNKAIAGSIILFLLLILSFSSLNDEIVTISNASGASAAEVLLGDVVPMIYIVIVIIFGGLIVYQATKKMG